MRLIYGDQVADHARELRHAVATLLAGNEKATFGWRLLATKEDAKGEER